MPVLRWVGACGYVDVRLRASGRCHIMHDDAPDVSAADLHGLPPSWLHGDACYCCAELPCAHTFHVSALALAFLSGDMLCPLCRRGCSGNMCPESIPAAMRGSFLRRLDEMESAASDAPCALSSALSSAMSSAMSSALASALPSARPSALPSPAASVASARMSWVLYDSYQACERQLHLNAEVRTSAHEVFVLESPVHLACRRDGATLFDMTRARHLCVHMRRFHTQRAFCRLVHSKMQGVPAGAAPVSVRFSLSHPLFTTYVGGVCAAGATQTVLSLRPRDGSGLLNLGLVRMDLAQRSLSLVLEPQLLLSLWREGLLLRAMGGL